MLHTNAASLSTGHHGIHITTQQTIILIPTIDYFYGHASSISPTFSYSGQLQEGFVMNDVQSVLIHKGRADLSKEL